jgi:hypothetical protein
MRSKVQYKMSISLHVIIVAAFFLILKRGATQHGSVGEALAAQPTR